MPQSLSRPATWAAAFGFALLFAPVAVQAHAILLAGRPEAGGTLEAGHHGLELRFNSRIDRARSTLRLRRPDRPDEILPVQPDGPPDTLRSEADLVPGAYLLRWQVLAVDGHVTRGDVRFTVRPPR